MPKRDLIDLNEHLPGLELSALKKVIARIEQQPRLIADARKLMFDKDARKSMRASWFLVHAAEEYPALVKKQLPYCLKLLQQPNRNTGTIRECLQLFQILGVPDKYSAPLFDICLGFVKNTTLPHAVRAFSINLLALICKKYPELDHEALLVLNELSSFPQAPSISVCVRRALQSLSKHQ